MVGNYFIWLFVFLAVAAVGLAVRRRHSGWGYGLVFLGIVGGAGLITWQVRSLGLGGGGRTVDRYSATAAYFMAHQVLAKTEARRGTVCLLLPPDTRSNQEQLDSVFDTFARVFAPFPQLKLSDLSIATSERRIAEGSLTLAEFDGALAECTDVVVCVSFVGVPKDVENLAVLRAEPPMPLFVFDPSGGFAWRDPLKQGLIRSVIVPRPDASPDEGPSAAPPDQLFARFFLLVTPANADGIANRIKEGSGMSTDIEPDR